MRAPRRCAWPNADDRLMVAYHDEEWGVPLHDERKLFEFLVLDAFQAGLSWSVILNKREGFRKVFHRFDAERIARYTSGDVTRALRDSGIVRNRAKIEATITNARAFLDLRAAEGSFDTFIWQFVGGEPKQYRRRASRDIPTRSRESDAMSAGLKARGFTFVGTTICYAFMQAAGMVNDHLVRCFRHAEVRALAS